MLTALDATYSLGDRLSGVGVYSRQILRHLAALDPGERFRWCYRPHRFLRSFRHSLPGNCGRRLLWESRAVRCDLFHGLNQRLPLWKPRRSVATFHDLFVMTGNYSTPEYRARFTAQARRAAERADLIICVSGFTATQVHHLLGVEQTRLRVIWHGSEPPAIEPLPDSARENIVLHVGAIQTRKNISALLTAFEHLDPSWRLVLAGSRGFGSEEILAAVERSPARARIELPGYLPDSALRALYSRARILAFPSLDEGFGIPVLEAMRHGLPVLTSRASALEEVAGAAALLVDPRDADELRAGLERLATDAALRCTLAARGLARAAQCTWDAAAEKTWAVYRELAG